ncbi:fumarylacetoacetate (FAA) hydrolase family protein [Sarocladium implicatum]|nr:fumarylacetoacetate (FAA) hydrolase family protein [Sarocladium implicatum]
MGSPTQYVAFVHPDTASARVGHYDLTAQTIQPLSFTSGTPVTTLYQVIEAGASNIIPDGASLSAQKLTILPPISGRDILAVGKNYSEHAKEFNSSGFDSSDQNDQPTHPVIFTKRATSIIADGEDIFPHPSFTQTIDYEGEIGVIISRPGFQIEEANAMDYVWGYTIINDMTARERQRDHKQFFIGKSPDTFCPIGPIAVAKEDLPSVLRLQTHVNGELRQDATTNDLIFSVPYLIKTISEGQTFQTGDVIATGTPAGVGIGKKPPIYLQPGDEITVTVDGLGTLRNKIASPSSSNPTVQQVAKQSAITAVNTAKSLGTDISLTQVNGKPLNYQRSGSGDQNIVFVHGLGGTLDYWTPLISELSLDTNHTLHLFDLEGHGMSPTHPLSDLTVESFAADVRGIFDVANVSEHNPAVLVAHSLGCLVAVRFVLDNPGLVKKLILVGPPPSPLPSAASDATFARAALVRSKGMNAVAQAVANAGTSERSKKENPLAIAAIRLSLLGQDPESYAKACWALARAQKTLDMESIEAQALIIAGEEDKVSTSELCRGYAARINQSQLTVLKETGHWHVYENLTGTSQAIKDFL